MIKQAVVFLMVSIAILFVSCSTDLAGTGTETSTKVIGVIVDTANNPVSNVEVMIIPADHNPVTDQPLPDSMKDVTDNAGTYQFNGPATGTYNIEATHSAQGTGLLIQGVAVQAETTYVQTGTLRSTKDVHIILPGTITNGYVYIEGTTKFKEHDGTNDTLDLDDIPSGPIPDIYLYPGTGTQKTLLAKRATNITSGNTTIESGLIKTSFKNINGENRFDLVKSCVVDDANNIWVGVNGGGLFNYNSINDTWKNYDFFGYIINQVKIDHDGMKWIGSNNGLYMFDGNSFIPRHTLAGETIYDEVRSIHVDAGNRKWVVFDIMIFKGDNDNWEKCNYGNSHRFTDLLVDKSDNVWITTAGNGFGIYYETNTEFYSTINTPMLPSDSITFVREDSEGTIWMGTVNGLIKIPNGNMWEMVVYTKSNGWIAHDVITEGAPIEPGNMWFVGDSSFLVNFGESITYSSNFLFGNSVILECLALDQTGALWTGGYGEGLLRIEKAVKSK